MMFPDMTQLAKAAEVMEKIAKFMDDTTNRIVALESAIESLAQTAMLIKGMVESQQPKGE